MLQSFRKYLHISHRTELWGNESHHANNGNILCLGNSKSNCNGCRPKSLEILVKSKLSEMGFPIFSAIKENYIPKGHILGKVLAQHVYIVTTYVQTFLWVFMQTYWERRNKSMHKKMWCVPPSEPYLLESQCKQYSLAKLEKLLKDLQSDFPYMLFLLCGMVLIVSEGQHLGKAGLEF